MNQSHYLAAFKAYQHKPLLPTHQAASDGVFERDSSWLRLNSQRYYYWEGVLQDFADSVPVSQIQTRVRHDQPLSRKRWQFAPRQEHYFYQGGE